MSLSIFVNTMRPNFLVLVPICVFLGLSVVIASGLPYSLFDFVLILVGALLAHISVNMLNEYSDFTSGLDFKTNKTAFSGGSGALPEHPEMAKRVLFVGVTSLIVSGFIGLYFVQKVGGALFPIGITGVLLVVTYTSWINKFPLACLFAPGLGFGVLMVIGTQIALVGTYLPQSALVALVPFFLVNNLLLLNQYPDIEADKSVGRNHFPIAYGVNTSNIVYALFLIMTIAVIMLAVAVGHLLKVSLFTRLPLILGFYVLKGAVSKGINIGHTPQYLAINVVVTLVSTAVLGISLIF